MQGAPPPGHDHEDAVLVGMGDSSLVPGLTYMPYLPPGDAIGFDFEGAVNYTYAPACHGDTCEWKVDVYAPAGAFDVPFTIDWVERGAADVVFGVSPVTNCVDPTCRFGLEVRP